MRILESMPRTPERVPRGAARIGRDAPCREASCHAATCARSLLLALAIAAPGAAAAARLAATPPSGIGVWYQPGAPRTTELWRPGDAGQRLFLRGRVLDTNAAPIAGATIELWHADANSEVHADRYRATLRSDAGGQFRVSTVLPGYIWGPRHIHFVVSHPQHPRFITRIFFKRDPEVAFTGDPALAVLLEDGTVAGETVLLGEVRLVLPAP